MAAMNGSPDLPLMPGITTIQTMITNVCRDSRMKPLFHQIATSQCIANFGRGSRMLGRDDMHREMLMRCKFPTA